MAVVDVAGGYGWWMWLRTYLYVTLPTIHASFHMTLFRSNFFFFLSFKYFWFLGGVDECFMDYRRYFGSL